MRPQSQSLVELHRVASDLTLMAKLIEQKHQVALKARPMIWHSTSLTFQKKSGTKNDDSRKCVQQRQRHFNASEGESMLVAKTIGISIPLLSFISIVARLICTLIFLGCRRALIFLGCSQKFFRVASARFFQGGSLKKAGFHTCKSEKKIK